MGKSKEMFIKIHDEMVNAIDKFENGEVSALDTLLYLRGFRDEAEQIIKDVKQFEDDNLEEIEREAVANGGSYNGFEIKKVNGRKTFSFKNIAEISELEKSKKELETKYKQAFEGYQKGVVQTTTENNQTFWIDENGELKPFPSVSYSSSYITIKNKNNVRN